MTDSKETIRARVPLAVYFPETVECELECYPTVEQLKHYSGLAGFAKAGQEVTERAYTLTEPSSYLRKAFSCLRLSFDEVCGVLLLMQRGDPQRHLGHGPSP
ncbi:MAG TPA: hypothetical protein VJA21_30180 [Verrucomicrobiae bacterium]